MYRLATCLLLLALVSAACTESTDSRETIRGSGNLITEARPVGDFDRLLIEGFGEVILDIGPEVSLEVEAEDNVMPRLTTEVRSGRLVIGIEPRTSFQNVDEPIYRVTAPGLKQVTISGSGSVTTAELDEEEFEVTISGSGSVTPAGSAGHIEVVISGSGGYHGADLSSATGSISISGSGSAVVNASETLDITIGGSGSVEYIGTPRLTQSIGGTGEIRQR